MGDTFCPASADWGDVATWLSAVASFLAVLAALGLARRAERARRDEDRQLAVALSDAFSDELRAVHYRLTKLALITDHANQVGTSLPLYKTNVAGLMTPVFDAFSDSIRHYDPSDAKRIYRAYGNVIRLRLNLEKNLPDPAVIANHADKLAAFFRGLRALATPVIERVEDATRATWSYTDHADRDPFEDAAPAEAQPGGGG